MSFVVPVASVAVWKSTLENSQSVFSWWPLESVVSPVLTRSLKQTGGALTQTQVTTGSQ